MKKRSLEGIKSVFQGSQNSNFSILQCKYDTLHIFNKTPQDLMVWRVTLKFLANLDSFTNTCVAIFCENAYFWRNDTKKMANFQKKWPKCATITKITFRPIIWTRANGNILHPYTDVTLRSFGCLKKNGFRAEKQHFWPENLHFFTLHPYNPHFLGSDGSNRMGS